MKEDNIIKCLRFSDDFYRKYTELKQQLPYHINVIDELHIDENAHSRILCKLLQCKNPVSGEYEILQSLLDYIRKRAKDKTFERIELINPIITQEKARIDLWIRDQKTGYAVIVENKVYNAQDQEEQLSRYIQRTKDDGFSSEHIYVVYLSRTGEEPDEQSWGEYKEDFETRYVNLSFRDDILEWLKMNILPEIRQKDTYLLHAVKEYVDYLEGEFDIRDINKKMNKDMNENLKNALGIGHDTDNQTALEILTRKRDEVNSLINYIDSTINEVKDNIDKNYVDRWKKSDAEKIIENAAQTIASDLNLQTELHFGDATYMYIAFRKGDWELSIVFEKYHTHKFFVYIGLPGEKYVDQHYVDLKSFIFNCHNARRNHPFGWEWIYYNDKPEELLRDIINMDSFKNFIMKYLKGILAKIKENNINLS